MKKTLCAVVILCMVVTIPSSQAVNVSVFDDPIYVDTTGGFAAESDILTTTPNKLVKEIHPRMPVMLPLEACSL